jgi:hypothetical protein
MTKSRFNIGVFLALSAICGSFLLISPSPFVESTNQTCFDVSTNGESTNQTCFDVSTNGESTDHICFDLSTNGESTNQTCFDLSTNGEVKNLKKIQI